MLKNYLKLSFLVVVLFFVSKTDVQAQTVQVINGTISPQNPQVYYGDNMRFNYLPKTGYELDSVIVNGVSKGKDSLWYYTLTNINYNSSLRVVFKRKQFGIAQTTIIKRPNLSDSIIEKFIGTKAPIDLPIDFNDLLVNSNVTDFEGAITIDTTIDDEKYKLTTKPTGAQPWAGTTIGDVSVNMGGLATNLPNDQAPIITVFMYAPAANIPVNLKIENKSDATKSVETKDTTTIAGWQTLTFDFSNQNAGTAAWSANNTYNKLSIFFDFLNTANGKQFIWNNVVLLQDDTTDVPEDSIISLSPIDLPIDFNDTTVNSIVTDFGGAITTDSFYNFFGNTKYRFKKTIKPVGAESWAGTTIGDVSVNNGGIASNFPNNVAPIIKVLVFAPAAGIPVLFKIEDKTNGEIFVQTTDTTRVANDWDTLTFDFSKQSANTQGWSPQNTYNKLNIFFDFLNAATGKTFLWNDIFLANGTVVLPPTPIDSSDGLDPIDLPIDFNDTTVNSIVTDFGGAITSDSVSGNNRFKKTIKPVGAQTWAGTTIGDTAVNKGGIASNFPNNVAPIVKVLVYAPAVGIPVLLKIENKITGSINTEVQVNTKVANAWDTLTFDFSTTTTWSTTQTYNKISIFFDFNNLATGKQFLWNNVWLANGSVVLPPSTIDSTKIKRTIDLPINFDDTNVNNKITDFEGAVTRDSIIGNNRFKSTIKPVGAQAWAGTTIGDASVNSGGIASNFPNNVAPIVKVLVYAPAVGIPVLLKIENKDNGNVFVETKVNTRVANAWDTLTFDFSNPGPNPQTWSSSQTYNKIAIFFDFLNAATGKQFLWDNVWLANGNVVPEIPIDTANALRQIDLPILFNDTNVDYSTTDFGGNVTVDSLSADGDSILFKVTTKTVGSETWAGTTMGNETGTTKGAIVTTLPKTQAPVMSVYVYSPTAGTPVRLKLEDKTTTTVSVETQVMTTSVGWQTLTFNFANQAAGTAAWNNTMNLNKISIFFNFNTAGNGEKYFWNTVLLVPSN